MSDKKILYLISAAIAATVVLVLALYWAVGSFPDEPVSEWSQSEAIFFSSVIISLAIFFKPNK